MTVLERKTIRVLRLVRGRFVLFVLGVVPQKLVGRHKVALQPCSVQTDRFNTLLDSSFGSRRTMGLEEFLHFQSGFFRRKVFRCGFHQT